MEDPKSPGGSLKPDRSEAWGRNASHFKTARVQNSNITAHTYTVPTNLHASQWKGKTLTVHLYVGGTLMLGMVTPSLRHLP